MCTVVDRMKENELKRTPQKIRLQWDSNPWLPIPVQTPYHLLANYVGAKFFQAVFLLLKFINNSKDLILFRCSEKVTFVKFSHKPEIKGTQTQDIKATAKLLKSIG